MSERVPEYYIFYMEVLHGRILYLEKVSYILYIWKNQEK